MSWDGSNTQYTTQNKVPVAYKALYQVESITDSTLASLKPTYSINEWVTCLLAYSLSGVVQNPKLQRWYANEQWGMLSASQITNVM